MQAHDEPQYKNTNEPQLLDCVYLQPMYNSQGSHKLLHLQTNKVVKRRNLTKKMITQSINKQVHALVILDDMQQGFKKQIWQAT